MPLRNFQKWLIWLFVLLLWLVWKTGRIPVLLIHGDDDRNVLFSESVELAEVLRKQGVEVEQLVFPDEVHAFLLHQNWVKAFEATFRFITKHSSEK